MRKLQTLAYLLILIGNMSCTAFLVEATGDQGIQEDPTDRTTGQVIEDRSIQTKITVNMKSQERAFRDAHFDVISHNGVVLLVGQVASEELKAKATEIASQASSKIRRIHNELEVAGKTGLLARGNDTWIATKVRTQMLANSEVPSGQVRVITENGAVYLMGLISEIDGERAASLARNVAGVTRVVKVFEYIN